MSQDTTTKTNMAEKLAWMSRSKTRIIEHKDAPIEVQDHFLSYIHASRLIWFYFGRYLKAEGRPDKAVDLVDKWKSTLSRRQVEIWDFITELRTEDVHTQPVPVKNTQKPGVLAVNGKVLMIGGKLLKVGNWQYKVDVGGTKEDVFSLIEESFPLFEKFIDEFNTL